MNGWQPIKTAPRDGTWLLLWCDWHICGKWIADGERVKGGWTDDEYGTNPIYMVTHWMSLPPPPPTEQTSEPGEKK